MQTEDGHTIKALTLTWAKDPNSDELSEGELDLEYWQKNHKSSMLLTNMIGHLIQYQIDSKYNFIDSIATFLNPMTSKCS